MQLGQPDDDSQTVAEAQHDLKASQALLGKHLRKCLCIEPAVWEEQERGQW